MGVKGLWRLLLPIGRRISIETLEGQILAIDASIWLTQFLTVAARQREQDLMGDGSAGGMYSRSSGKAYSYDYLVGFLRRLCKLRYQGIRPVFVFDGETPEIKRREIRERNRRRKRKLGDSFYLGGDKKGANDFNTKEEEELLEATRRMAKQILAKQLRTGQLVTTKSKRKKAKTIKDDESKFRAINNTNGKSKPTIASGSYAPGFYDPDATVVAPENRGEQGTVESTKDVTTKDIDDDHLLRDDYNTNPLREEINDWDRPIVVESDDENNHNNNTHSTKKNSSMKTKERPFFQKASKFHAGDGTEFKIESAADLPESDRKDVVEDALKQRRLASRREFMKVASNSDGFSSCQLKNFLKSTKLNRDVAKMAQTAKGKADEEAKMILGNGILFEKNNSRSYMNGNNTNAATGSRQHYRLGASNSTRRGRKKSNMAMMRMFHHKDQPQKAVTIANNEDGDDEHDFRKARNNHYLSGGIPFINSEDEEEKDNVLEEYLGEEKDSKDSRYRKAASATISSDDHDGGFVVSIMDGSEKTKQKAVVTTSKIVDSSEIIEIDSTSESEVDDTSNDDRKPHAAKSIIKSKKSLSQQELEDGALARALQNIEEDEIAFEETDSSCMNAIGKRDANECIELNDSDDGNYAGGGFLKEPIPSEDRNMEEKLSRQELEDERLARALQEAEYEDEEDQDNGGGFLVESKENSNVNEEHMCYDGGFLVASTEDNNDKEEKSDDDKKCFAPKRKGKNTNAVELANVERLRKPVEENRTRVLKSPSHKYEGNESDIKTNREEVTLQSEEQNPFASICTNDSTNIFAMSKQRFIDKSENDLLVCNESSEDEAVEDIDRKSIKFERKEHKVFKHNNAELSQDDTKSVVEIEIDEGNDDGKINWEDGTKEANEIKPEFIDASMEMREIGTLDRSGSGGIKETRESESVSNKVHCEEGDNEKRKIISEIPSENEESKHLPRTSTAKNENKDESEDEVDWVNGDEKVCEKKSGFHDSCEEKRETNLFDLSTSNVATAAAAAAATPADTTPPSKRKKLAADGDDSYAKKQRYGC